MRQCGLLLALVACAHNVPQDRQTGPDGKQKGAKAIAFENGEGKVKGVVTYPGGDRIDWRLVEIPEGQKGVLDLQLSYRTPRPGLQVAFDVFDQWNTPVTQAVGRRGRLRTASIPDARGKYFVRVYAPKRGDAGQYTLVASFKEVKPEGSIDLTKVPVPDPPKLAAIPEPEGTCETFEPNNKACAKACPFDAPQGWKGCKERDDKAAADAARKAAEEERKRALANAPKPFEAKIKYVQVKGSALEVTIAAGNVANPKLDRSWTAQVIGSDSKPIIGANVRILGVDGKQTRAEIRGLNADQVNANPRVLLTPPPLSP